MPLQVWLLPSGGSRCQGAQVHQEIHDQHAAGAVRLLFLPCNLPPLHFHQLQASHHACGLPVASNGFRFPFWAVLLVRILGPAS